MKKKLGVIITLLTLCICLMTPQMHAKAASGKTTIAVSAGSLNIGQTVTVTAKALSASGDSAYANMVLTYDAGILEFVSCNATYGGGGGSISVASDSFSVTLKAIAAGKASISLSATDGVIFSTAEELDSMAGSSTSVTVKNEAAGGNSTNNGSSGSNGNAGNGRIPSHRVQYVIALSLFKTGDNIPHRIVAHMPHVDFPRRIRRA